MFNYLLLCINIDQPYLLHLANLLAVTVNAFCKLLVTASKLLVACGKFYGSCKTAFTKSIVNKLKNKLADLYLSITWGWPNSINPEFGDLKP
jgi:hypothetical protein